MALKIAGHSLPCIIFGLLVQGSGQMAVGDDGLRDAIAFYTEWVYNVSVIGPDVAIEEWQAPLFTYIMTNKQFNELNVICRRNGWPPQTNRGITFYPHVIKHILTSRTGKDRLTWPEVAEIISAALNSRSAVVLKRDYNQQVIVLNSVDVLRIGRTKEKFRGALIVEVSINDLAPITAYHANEAKVRTIMRDRG